MQMTFRWYGQDDPVKIEYIRQIPGMKGIVTAIYDIPVGEVWPLERILELKKEIESLMFENVKTYLNSGNVIFSSRENIEKITKQIEEMLKKNYDFKIPVFVLEQEKLKDILEHAPIWWGSDDKMIYDNLIFMIPPITFKEVFEEIGEAKEGLEKIQNYKDVIFWSFSRKDYQKTNWWPKTANTNVSKKITIRTANTIRKIVKI